jgi:hypothetical protein
MQRPLCISTCERGEGERTRTDPFRLSAHRQVAPVQRADTKCTKARDVTLIPISGENLSLLAD